MENGRPQPQTTENTLETKKGDGDDGGDDDSEMNVGHYIAEIG